MQDHLFSWFLLSITSDCKSSVIFKELQQPLTAKKLAAIRVLEPGGIRALGKILCHLSLEVTDSEPGVPERSSALVPVEI